MSKKKKSKIVLYDSIDKSKKVELSFKDGIFSIDSVSTSKEKTNIIKQIIH